MGVMNSYSHILKRACPPNKESHFFKVTLLKSEETLPILLFYGYFTRIVFLDQLLFDFDAFAGIDCLHETHLDCNVFIFPRSKYSTHPSTLVIKIFYLPDSGRHVTSVHQGLSQAGAGEEPGYEVAPNPARIH